MQNENSDLSFKLLKGEFRTAFLDQFLDCVQDVFDFFQSNLIAYKASPLYRLNRVLDLMLSSFLREMLLKSLKAWQALVNTHTFVPVDTRVLEAKGTSEVLRMRATEATFSLASSTPLFQVEFRVMNGRVVLEPSVDEIQSAFTVTIDKMVAMLRGVASVDKETMNLLTLDTRVLLNIGAGDPLFADLDAIVKKAKSYISSRISAAMQRPLALASLFENFIWLMEYDDCVDAFSSQQPPPTQEDYKRELLKLDNAAKTIHRLSFAFEDFDLVRVNTVQAKQMLAQHAIEMRDSLLATVIPSVLISLFSSKFFFSPFRLRPHRSRQTWRSCGRTMQCSTELRRSQ